jgi:hypothetical protein
MWTLEEYGQFHCSNRPYLSTNVTGAIKHFTSVQEVNDCDSGYDDGWNQYCHVGLAKLPDSAASCTGAKIESLNTSGTLP